MTREQRLARQLELLTDPDATVARRAEGRLAKHYGSEAIPGLIKLCDHDEPRVRYRAVWVLGGTKAPAAYETILRLTGDLDEGVRYDAILALGKLGDSRAIGPLIEIALDADASQPAHEALRDLGAVDALIQLYRRGDAGCRQGAVNCIAHRLDQTGDRSGEAVLREATNDPERAVAEDAKYWLEELAALGKL